jgi:hypothetical protein
VPGDLAEDMDGHSGVSHPGEPGMAQAVAFEVWAAEFGHTDRMRRGIAKASKVLLIVSFIGFMVSLMLNLFVLDEFDAYGEVPIPGTGTLHLPAGDVTISFHGVYPEGVSIDNDLSIPDGLEVTITPPSGVAEPSVTEKIGYTTTGNNDDGWRSVRVAHIPQAGDYTITTNGKTEFVSPRLAFGHSSRFWFLTWLFGGLGVVILVAGVTTFLRGVRTASDAGPPMSADDARVRSNLIAARSNAPPPAAQPNEQKEDEQRRQNWAAIDSLVQEFIPEAVRRKTPMQRARLR